MKKYALMAILALIVALGGIYLYATWDQEARLPETALEGREPQFTAQRKEIIPSVRIADPIGWAAGAAPTAAKGYAVTRFAEGLDHPRSLYRLPNGDVLVAETRGPKEEPDGLFAWVQSKLMASAGAGGVSANRITLLRDSNGDGKADQRFPFLTGLNSPYGMALIGDTLYVANVDSLVAFPYKEGETRITAKARKILNLPSKPAGHWTRTLVASPDGDKLYVGIGSATNIADKGLDVEENRAVILEVEPKSGKYNIYASGLRNPSGLAINPDNGALWAVVNERDMLGPDLVPDYLTEVEFAAFYGWPWNYWGGYEDKRVQPERPELREYTRRPDFGLGAHVAPLGISFGKGSALGGAYQRGAFVALHGSWNRKPPAGYKVVFVSFDEKQHAQGKPADFLTGFIDVAKGEAFGRPVDVMVAKDGALLVSDDVGNIVWRVTARK